MATYNELKEEAKSLGLEIKGNPKSDELEEMVRVAKEEAEIAARANGYDTPKAEVSVKVEAHKKKPMTRHEAMKMVKVKITPLDELMKGLPSEYYSISNRNIGEIQQVIKFNKPYFAFKLIVDMLKDKKMLVATGTTGHNGKPEFEEVDAFAINGLELTKEEIETIKNNK